MQVEMGPFFLSHYTIRLNIHFLMFTVLSKLYPGLIENMQVQT